MQVIVQVSADIARALHQLIPPTDESEQLLRIVRTCARTLEPMHRDTDNPNLQSYFTVEVPDRATAELTIDRLRQITGIEAAYVKPSDELP